MSTKLVLSQSDLCGRPHRYMRFGDGTDLHAERWTCTQEKGHDGRCSMGPLLWFEESPTAPLGAFVVSLEELPPLLEELPPLPRPYEQWRTRARHLHEIFFRDLEALCAPGVKE